MSTTPTGAIGLAEKHLSINIADSAAFRAMVGADDQAGALSRIHFDALPDPADGERYTRSELEAVRPYAMIWTETEEGYAFEHTSTGTHHHFDERGTLNVRFAEAVPAELDGNDREILTRFKNKVDAIVAEMLAVAGMAGYLAIESGAVSGVYRAAENMIGDEIDDFVAVDVRVEWSSGEE